MQAAKKDREAYEASHADKDARAAIAQRRIRDEKKRNDKERAREAEEANAKEERRAAVSEFAATLRPPLTQPRTVLFWASGLTLAYVCSNRSQSTRSGPARRQPNLLRDRDALGTLRNPLQARTARPHPHRRPRTPQSKLKRGRPADARRRRRARPSQLPASNAS